MPRGDVTLRWKPAGCFIHAVIASEAMQFKGRRGEWGASRSGSPLRAAPLHYDAEAIARKCFQTRSVIAKRVAVPHTGWRSNG